MVYYNNAYHKKIYYKIMKFLIGNTKNGLSSFLNDLSFNVYLHTCFMEHGNKFVHAKAFNMTVQEIANSKLGLAKELSCFLLGEYESKRNFYTLLLSPLNGIPYDEIASLRILLFFFQKTDLYH